MEYAIVVFKVLLVMVAVIAAVAVTVVLVSTDECSDGPHGEHEFANERTATGWCGRCVWCGKLTKGIDAFARAEQKRG